MLLQYIVVLVVKKQSRYKILVHHASFWPFFVRFAFFFVSGSLAGSSALRFATFELGSTLFVFLDTAPPHNWTTCVHIVCKGADVFRRVDCDSLSLRFSQAWGSQIVPTSSSVLATRLVCRTAESASLSTSLTCETASPSGSSQASCIISSNALRRTIANSENAEPSTL